MTQTERPSLFLLVAFCGDYDKSGCEESSPI